MLLVIGSFRLPPQNMAAAREAMARVIEASLAETGCLAYSYADDVIEPGLVRVSEAWESREALAAHFEAAHMRQWQQERAELGMTDRNMAAFDICGEERL